MEILEIKTRLSILEVAQRLGIKIGKNQRAVCPFHDDKTPSLQFSKEKDICTCFSSACTAGTMDIVSLTAKYRNITTHEALKYLTVLAGGTIVETQPHATIQTEPPLVNYTSDFEVMQSSFLSSSSARNYAESRGLHWKQLQMGYNAFKESRFNYLRGCITFPLKDPRGIVVSMYGRSIRDNDTSTSSVQRKAKHYYSTNRKGLYPAYPKADITRLIITESVIDTATLQMVPEIIKDYGLLASYGTNGIGEEHRKAIFELKALEEIIFFFDGDDAGRNGVSARATELNEILPNVKISYIETPENEDINSLSIGHEPGIFIELLQNRKPFDLAQGKPFSFSKETFSTETVTAIDGETNHPNSDEKKKDQETPFQASEAVVKHASLITSPLDTSNPYKISYVTETALYFIKGGLPKAMDNLKITLEIENTTTSRKSRTKPDLYEDKQVEKVAREASEKLGIRANLLEVDLNRLTDLLDRYREGQYEAAKLSETKTEKIMIPMQVQTECLAFLQQKDLIQKFNQQIQIAGITGEDNNRIFLFVIATSYKMPDTLHALIQGSSGSGKTYLSRQITDLMPPEDVIRLTRVTESSFYNYGETELQHKLIALEDVDGLKEEAEFAFRELQSNGEIISSTSVKDEASGSIRAQIKRVRGPIGSIATTTRGEIYEDNMSRIFLLAVDESREQTGRIIGYQNQRAAGDINKSKERETRVFIQNCIRMLRPYEVVNPFANKILLPAEAHKIRRLTELYHSFINQVTLLNQYQRKQDAKGRLVTQKEDIETAIEIMFESIILKIDELDGSLRQFYEDLKVYIIAQGGDFAHYKFTQREIRQTLRVSKSQLQRYVNDLLQLEYISQWGGFANRGFSYKINYWDNIKALREKIKQYMQEQLNKL